MEKNEISEEKNKNIRKKVEQTHIQNEIKAIDEWVKGLSQEEINTGSLLISLRDAEKGDASAQVRLGQTYELGVGVKKDGGHAFYWYYKAAEQGHVLGQSSVGRMYERGIGVEKNKEQAIYWYKKAAAQGNKAALKFLSENK